MYLVCESFVLGWQRPYTGPSSVDDSYAAGVAMHSVVLPCIVLRGCTSFDRFRCLPFSLATSAIPTNHSTSQPNAQPPNQLLHHEFTHHSQSIKSFLGASAVQGAKYSRRSCSTTAFEVVQYLLHCAPYLQCSRWATNQRSS